MQSTIGRTLVEYLSGRPRGRAAWRPQGLAEPGAMGRRWRGGDDDLSGGGSVIDPFAPEQLGPRPEFLTPGQPGRVVGVRTPLGASMWLVRGYELARQILSDPRFSRAAAVRPEAPKVTTANPAANSVMSLDGADHARLRRLAARAFTPRRVAALTPSVERVVVELLDRLAEAGPPADLVAGYAGPLPLAVLSTLLGIPRKDHDLFATWVDVLFDVTASDDHEKLWRRVALVDYMSDLIERKRREPGQDLLSTLVDAQGRGELSKAELINLGVALLTAGYQTTVAQIGLSALVLLLDRASREAMQDGGIAPVVEELLRLTPSTPVAFPRVAVEDVELDGTTIRAGEAVIVSILDSNRDAAVFDHPDQLTPGGQPAAHLTFGHGPHYCLGAPLARIQLVTALHRLFRRFPGLQLADDEAAVMWQDGLATRGLSRLEVSW
jgi:cytochrome P450